MIRAELKVDPIGYMSKFILNGVADLTWIERLYVINKCPQLFQYINNATRIDERLYIHKLRYDAGAIKVRDLKHRSNVKKALKMCPSLCANLELDLYEEEINIALSKIRTKDRDTFLVLLDNNKENKSFVRKVLMFRPDLISMIPNIQMFNDDSDLQIFVYKCNPRLVERFDVLSPITIDYIIGESFNNVKFINGKTIDRMDRDTLLSILLHLIVDDKETSYDTNIVKSLINDRQEIFAELIRMIVTYDGFSSNAINDIVVKRLLRDFSDMINDDVAEIVIHGGF